MNTACSGRTCRPDHTPDVSWMRPGLDKGHILFELFAIFPKPKHCAYYNISIIRSLFTQTSIAFSSWQRWQ